MTHNKLKIGIVIAFSFLLLIAISPTVKAENPLWSSYILTTNLTYSAQTADNETYQVAIINRDVGFVYFCNLNETLTSNVLADGWAFIYPLSENLNFYELILGYLNYDISKCGFKYSSIFNPYFTIYNDTNLDGYLTTNRSATDNSTEAIFTVHPYKYESLILTNLTPQQNYNFADSKPNVYSWGLSFENVSCNIRNATMIIPNGNYDGSLISQDNFTWINKTYTYRYDSTNQRFQLNYSIDFGVFSNETTFLNRSLATVHYLVGGKTCAINAPAIKDNNSNLFNTTYSIETPYLDFANVSSGCWDMVKTKKAYVWNETVDANSTSTTSPITPFNITINATKNYYFNGIFDANITGTLAKAYICYDEWNGTQLEIDPYFFLRAPTMVLPTWALLIPDICAASLLEQQNTMLIILAIAIAGFLIALFFASGGKNIRIRRKPQKKRRKKRKKRK